MRVVLVSLRYVRLVCTIFNSRKTTKKNALENKHETQALYITERLMCLIFMFVMALAVGGLANTKL